MNWKIKANKAIKAMKEDEFFSWQNPLILIVFVIIIAGIIVKIFS